MVRGRRRRLALAVAALVAPALWGCGPRETVYQLRLVTTSCTGPSPMEGVTHFLFRVTGEGLDPIDVTTLATTRQLQLPPIPVGNHRAVEVRAYAGEPKAGGRLVSLGRSLAFDVPEVPLTLAQDLTVFVRPVNMLTPINLSLSPQSCARMGYPHAGHSATVMKDGKVLLAGGYEINPASGERVASAHAELFDPATGGFSDLPDLSFVDAQQRTVLTPRAFHSGTLVAGSSGKVLLAGGEVYVPGGVTPQPQGTALLFDPQARAYTLVPMRLERSQHGAAADSGGRILLLGGITAGGALAQSLEWFNPTQSQFTDVPAQQLSRVQMGVSAVQGGRFVAVAGGSTGAAVTSEVRLYGWDTSAFTFTVATTSQLLEPRRAPAMSWVGDPTRLVALGGYSNLNEITGVSPLASTEVLATAPQVQVSSGPNIAVARGDACAATLADGRLLFSGGRGVDFNMAARSMENVELVVQSSTGGQPSVLGLPNLARGRYFHSCTTLQDGTVLIAGGEDKQGTLVEVVQDAYVFTPAPLD